MRVKIERMNMTNSAVKEMECMSDDELVVMMDSCDKVNHLLEVMDEEIALDDKNSIAYSHKELLYLIPNILTKLVPNKDIVYDKKDSLYQVFHITNNVFFRIAISILILLGCGIAFWNTQQEDSMDQISHMVANVPNVLGNTEDAILPIEPVTSLFSNISNAYKKLPEIVVVHREIETLILPTIPGDVILSEAATYWVTSGRIEGDIEINHGTFTP